MSGRSIQSLVVVGAAALVVAASLLAVGCAAQPGEERGLAGPIRASASVDRAELAFGDEITLTIEVLAEPAREVQIAPAGAFDGLRTVDQGTVKDVQGGLRVERRWYRLRAEQPGELMLPAFEVRHRELTPAAGSPEGGGAGNAPAGDGGAWEILETAAIPVRVRSRVEAAAVEAPELRDIKPLQPVSRPRIWLRMAVAVTMAMALAAALALWLRGRRSRPAPPVPAVPAHEIALAALDRLAAAELADADAVRRFHFELSEVVRGYVEGRFGLNATDLTTEEITAALGGLELSDAAAASLRKVLGDADRVKFAAHLPARDEVLGILGRARSFVEDTRTRAQPEAPAAREAA